MDQWPLAKLDWSEEAALALHEYESRGVGVLSAENGYAIGKRWIDWQIQEWSIALSDVSDGIALLLPIELVDEPLAARIPAVKEIIDRRKHAQRV